MPAGPAEVGFEAACTAADVVVVVKARIAAVLAAEQINVLEPGSAPDFELQLWLELGLELGLECRPDS